MKTRTLGLAATLLIAMGGTAAADGLKGYGEAFVGGQISIDIDTGLNSEGMGGHGGSVFGGGGFGLVAPGDNGWNFQLDGAASGAFDGTGSTFLTAQGGGSPHIYYRDDDYAAGLFASIAYMATDDRATGVAEPDDEGFMTKFMLGLRFYLDGETIKSNDRKGATFPTPPWVNFQELAAGNIN